MTCRHCDYHGKGCPSWCMGIIGGKLFKRSSKKDFFENGGGIKALLFDVSFLMLSTIFPFLFYGIVFFASGLSYLDYFLIIVYGIIGTLTLLIHNKGCKKCPIAACPLSGNHKKNKT